MNEDLRIVLVFSQPPPSWGFRRSKSGKCWWRKLERRWTFPLVEKLKAMGIRGVIKKAEPRTAVPAELVLRKSISRPRARSRAPQGRPAPYTYPYPEALREAARLDGR